MFGRKDRGLVLIPLENIVPNPDQPRTIFNKKELSSLSESIKEHGMIQPITVRKGEDEKYTIIAGERRYHAVKKLGHEMIPAVIYEGKSDTKVLALVENIVRADLRPLEEAEAFHELIYESPKMKQVDLARLIGRSKQMVSDTLSIKSLPDYIKDQLKDEKSNLNPPKNYLVKLSRIKNKKSQKSNWYRYLKKLEEEKSGRKEKKKGGKQDQVITVYKKTEKSMDNLIGKMVDLSGRIEDDVTMEEFNKLVERVEQAMEIIKDRLTNPHSFG
ncbi:ParB/RepB/Spo0J family partition protein [Magnetococcales bacterium HHB-1]